MNNDILPAEAVNVTSQLLRMQFPTHEAEDETVYLDDKVCK